MHKDNADYTVVKRLKTVVWMKYKELRFWTVLVHMEVSECCNFVFTTDANLKTKVSQFLFVYLRVYTHIVNLLLVEKIFPMTKILVIWREEHGGISPFKDQNGGSL